MQSSIAFCFTAGETELAKEVARYLHEDNEKVNDLSPKSFFLTGHTSTKLLFASKQKVVGLSPF